MEIKAIKIHVSTALGNFGNKKHSPRTKNFPLKAEIKALEKKLGLWKVERNSVWDRIKTFFSAPTQKPFPVGDRAQVEFLESTTPPSFFAELGRFFKGKIQKPFPAGDRAQKEFLESRP